MSENPVKTNNWTTEAPASWNTKYVTADGFVCQITLRGESGRDLLEKACTALAWLRDNGYKPCENFPYRSRSNGSTHGEDTSSTEDKANGNSHSASVCPIHQIEMKRWEKDGKVWFSHKVNGQWCTGKSK